MDLVSLLIAVVSSALCALSFIWLMLNCSGACTPLISVMCAAAFMVFSVVAAAHWKKSFSGKK